jgi:hypothetical protein
MVGAVFLIGRRRPLMPEAPGFFMESLGDRMLRDPDEGDGSCDRQQER